MSAVTFTSRPRPVARRGSGAARLVDRRRRIAVALLALVTVGVAARAGGALRGSPLAAPARRPAVVRYVVRPGDSLWSIAARLEPGDDPRPVVDALAAVRHGAPLVPGEVIVWSA